MLDKIQIVKPAEIEKRIKWENLAGTGVFHCKKMYPHFGRF